MATRISPRLQGDIGELSAMGWLVWHGAKVFTPIGHSPDVDLVADFGDRLVRVQVKTSTVLRHGRWEVTLATRGGNQSWSGLVKRFTAAHVDFLFVHVGDGRRWFIPSDAVDGGSGILLGGPKYAAYEVDADDPLAAIAAARLGTLPTPGGVPERSKGCGCKPHGSAFAGSNPAPAIVGPVRPRWPGRGRDGPRFAASAADSRRWRSIRAQIGAGAWKRELASVSHGSESHVGRDSTVGSTAAGLPDLRVGGLEEMTRLRSVRAA
jgi:hypothetical protein